MIYWLLVFTSIFALCASIVATVLILKYIKLAADNTNIALYLKKITQTVFSVRYGNLNARIEEDKNPYTKTLTSGLNSMFESILDRDIMIQEHIRREKELNIMKSDFIATLTHDLKVPIIAQDNTFDLFLNGVFGEISETQRQAIKNLKISNMDLKYLIEALLETYKMEQANVELSKTKDCSIVKVVSETLEQLNPIAQAHDRSINFNAALPEDYCADVDVFLLKRVIQNMILNALSHSVYSHCVDVSLYGNKNEFTIKVQDYGCGIARNEIEKIFQKYYSGSSNKFTKASTGLGLYLSNKIVKMHGGRIEVESVKPNEARENEVVGTTFYVVIPTAGLEGRVQPLSE